MSLLRRIEYIHPNLCTFCKYYDYEPPGDFRKCAVFTYFNRLIPVEIRMLRFDHRYPHPEDGGIQFERAKLSDAIRERHFQGKTDGEIERKFQQIARKLEKTHPDGIPPTNQGHLPAFWYMYHE